MRTIALVLSLLTTLSPSAQIERYDRKFFIQLRSVFGRFRDSDLQRVFENAQPIQCSELVNDEGEWRTVAFFNEKRELGDWYRRNFDEVKTDLAVFTFKGVCRGEHGPVQLATRFPVTESIDAFNEKRIGLDEVAVNQNAPVRVAFDVPAQAYTFELPYLFLISQRDGERLYSLDPPRLLDRYRYATDVIDHWACKSVTAENVTYQFLICRTTTLARNPAERSLGRSAFGASAYFILSDGKEASSSVKLSFGDSEDARRPVEDASVSNAANGAVPDVREPARWEVPDSDEKIMDVIRDEFRIRFAPQTWTSRIGSAQVLFARRVTPLVSARPPDGADYCMWLPGTASDAIHLLSEERVEYAITAHDRDGQSSTSIIFNLNTSSGTHMGTLQCNFLRASSAASIDFQRWTSVVGDHLSLEVKP